MDVGKRIAYLRQLQGLSIHALANQSGIAHSYFKSVEEGESNITVVKLEEICDSLGISLSEFFADDSNTQENISKKMRILACTNNLSEMQKDFLLSFLESLSNK